MRRHLKNSTLVNTEMLWGGAVLRWGLRAGAPVLEQDQEIMYDNIT
jgi:hypothetical protein